MDSEAAVELQKKIKAKNLPPMFVRDFHGITHTDDVIPKGPKVRVMQWNMLAQGLSADNFVLCPPEALELEARRLRIVEEITRTCPAILCMEECDQFPFLEEALGKFGYAGIFHPKPNSVCLKFDPNWGPDGVAIFYMRDKFEVLESYKYTLKDQDQKPTDQVALACKFHIKRFPADSATFVVAAAHLKAKEGFEELRRAQCQNLLTELSNVVGSLPLVVCGDFNDTHDQPFYHEMISHPLKLASAYTFSTQDGTEPPYTTWKVRGGSKGNNEVCRTIDYIWVSKEKVKANLFLRIPSEKEIGKGRLPCMAYPSDHFAIACELQFME